MWETAPNSKRSNQESMYANHSSTLRNSLPDLCRQTEHAQWLVSVLISGSTLLSNNKVTLRRARLVLGRVVLGGQTIFIT